MDRRSIKITPGRGLGNRLLSIAISQAISGIDKINWVKTPECNVNFYDLFSYPKFSFISDPSCYDTRQDLVKNNSIKDMMHQILLTSFHKKTKVKICTKFYETLRPSQTVFKQIKSIPDNTLGLHLRFTDHVQFMSEVDYEDRVYSVIEKVKPDNIFICSDTLYKKNYFIKALQDHNLIYYNLNLTDIIKEFVYSPQRNSHDGMCSAVAEMFALSKCRWILPNSISSFSMASFFMGQAKLL
jgi:hypothetical protein